ncbi:MAG: hypothetical protein JW965_00965 [Bacteroidales bacterium]|nr:hypothetical protein [Bacteroidales bacterium]
MRGGIKQGAGGREQGAGGRGQGAGSRERGGMRVFREVQNTGRINTNLTNYRE